VVLTKQGYVSHRVPLTINQKVDYPIEKVSLLPSPPEPGIWWIGPSQLVRLTDPPRPIAKVVESSRLGHRDFFASPSVKYGVAFFMEPPILTKAGTLRFIDNAPQPYLLVNLTSSGVIGTASLTFGGAVDSFTCTACAQGQRTEYAEEKIAVRMFDLAPGKYAWIPCKYRVSRGRRIPVSPAAVALPFRVN
jgi:hypothetical protein